MQSEPLQDVGQLVVGVLSPNERGPAQGSTHQQSPVLGKQHSVPPLGPLDQLVIVSVLVIRRIDTEQSKPAGQGAEVHIQEEESRTV
ncbi:MAG: hypothetical protein QOF35_1063 [Actinomycetota bacterium]|nr:hypothetical protein [Actinomycetota bacterium]